MRTIQNNNTPNTRVIQGKTYILKSLLGQGSFGKVYLADLVGDNTQQYAIKEQNQITEQEWNFCKFMSEKRFKNLVNLFAIEKNDNGKIYMVMEYCTISLYDKIQEKKFDPFQMRFVMKEIANGIKELHSMNLAHRDLKPENILIQKTPIEQQDQVQERYKICDFGTVKQKDRLQTKQVGTPYYLAPEQLEGNDNYTLKADIWSFGALCYELLTNKPLFDGVTVKEIEKKIRTLNVSQEIDKLMQLEKDHVELMKKMLQRNPNDRCDIDYVIKILVTANNKATGTIRTKSINRQVVKKNEILKSQLPTDTMQQKQQQFLQKVQQYKSTIQPSTFEALEQQAKANQQQNQFSNNINQNKNPELPKKEENDYQNIQENQNPGNLLYQNNNGQNNKNFQQNQQQNQNTLQNAPKQQYNPVNFSNQDKQGQNNRNFQLQNQNQQQHAPQQQSKIPYHQLNNSNFQQPCINNSVQINNGNISQQIGQNLNSQHSKRDSGNIDPNIYQQQGFQFKKTNFPQSANPQFSNNQQQANMSNIPNFQKPPQPQKIEGNAQISSSFSSRNQVTNVSVQLDSATRGRAQNLLKQDGISGVQKKLFFSPGLNPTFQPNAVPNQQNFNFQQS